MGRELKIVLTIFLIFFIFGLTSYFNSASFITPFFLSKIIFVIVAFLFYFLNFKEKRSFILLLYAIVLSLFSLLDQFTIIFVVEKWKLEGLYEIVNSEGYTASITILFLLFHFFAIYQLYKEKIGILLSLFLFIMLIATFTLLGTEISYFPQILMSLYLLTYFVITQYNAAKISKTIDILSIEFLLFFLLSQFEYFI